MTPLSAGGRLARLWHALTAVAALTGLIWQLVLTVRGKHILMGEGVSLPAESTRVIRYLSYFTIESNMLVAAAALHLATRGHRDGVVWRAVRLASLYGISVTGVVAATLLRGTVTLHGAAVITDVLLHTVTPVMAVLGFVLFGPRRRLTTDTLILSLVWPLLYVAYTLAHGAVTDWYPYPFINAHTLGYVTALRNGVGINLLLVGIGAVYLWADDRLPGGIGGPARRAVD